MPSNKVFIVLLLPALLLSDPLIDFFSGIAGERNYCMDIGITFHVIDPEKGKFLNPDPEVRFVFVVRNLEDFYIEMIKPEVFKGTKFAYLSDSGRLYSGFDGKYTIDVLQFEKGTLLSILKNFIDSLREPLFNIMKKDEGNYVVYDFEYTKVMSFIIRRLDIEPVMISAVVSKDPPMIEKIKLIGSGQEYVEMRIFEFRAGCQTDSYFKPFSGS